MSNTGNTLSNECELMDFEFSINGLKVSMESRVVKELSSGSVVGLLSESNRRLLKLFHDYKNQVVTKEQIKQYGWPNKAISDSSVLVAISEVRLLLGDESIMTVKNEGYLYVSNE